MSFQATIVASFLVLLIVAVVLGLLAWRGRNDPPDYDPEDDEATAAEIKADSETDRLNSDTQEFDVVTEAFEDYQRTIADLLDANPERSAELIRGLEAATDKWTRKRFNAITKPLRWDREFRQGWIAARDTRTTDQT